jgi:hypothetical protein
MVNSLANSQNLQHLLLLVWRPFIGLNTCGRIGFFVGGENAGYAPGDKFNDAENAIPERDNRLFNPTPDRHIPFSFF